MCMYVEHFKDVRYPALGHMFIGGGTKRPESTVSHRMYSLGMASDNDVADVVLSSHDRCWKNPLELSHRT